MSRGLVGQVKPLSICMIVQGVLEILMGGFYVAMSFFMPAMMMAGQPPGQMTAQQQEMMQTMQMTFGLIYGIGGGAAILGGILRITAGIRGLYFRNRILGIIANFAGLLSVVTCYCLPTSIGLSVWGAIVHFNSPVKRAFALGDQGMKPSEIVASFPDPYRLE